jgi:cysteine desulfurase
MSVRLGELGVDLLTINGAKLYGPRGVGALYVRRGTKLTPIIHGGGQEYGFRGGTENLAGIVGFVEAIKIADEQREEESARLASLAAHLRDGLAHIEGVECAVPASAAAPSIVNASFADIEGESLLLELDCSGVCCSTGSACAAADLSPSHVLLAMGVPLQRAHGSLRFSLGRFTTTAEIDQLLAVLPRAVERIRAITPAHVAA